MLLYLGLEGTKFEVRVFTILDHDKSGTIDFREFVFATWNYCTVIEQTLPMLAFDLYDLDGSGLLKHNEVTGMMNEIFGNKKANTKQSNAYQQVMKEVTALEKSDLFDLEAFRALTTKNSLMLQPAFELQRLLRNKIMNTKFWLEQSEKRVEISKGKLLRVGDYLKECFGEDVFGEYIKAADRRKEKKIEKLNDNRTIIEGTVKILPLKEDPSQLNRKTSGSTKPTNSSRSNISSGKVSPTHH